MIYLFVVLLVAVLLIADFGQECRFIRGARGENLRYGELLAEMVSDKPTLIGTILLASSVTALAVFVAAGSRLPDDAIPLAGLALLFVTAVTLKAVGLNRLIGREQK